MRPFLLGGLALGAAGATLLAVAIVGDDSRPTTAAPGANKDVRGPPSSRSPSSPTIRDEQPRPLPPPSGAERQPNIVFITTDDQTLASMNEDTMPNTVQLLGEQGTTFSNAIVTTPLCCPSRASMLTGQYAHNHGVQLNNPGYASLRGKQNVLPAWLRRAGYRTAHVGKYLNGYPGSGRPAEEVGPGWDEWYTLLTPRRYYDYDLSVNGRSIHLGNRDRDYLTRVLTREAVRLIRRYAPGRKPLFLQLDHKAPHTGKADESGRCGRSAVPDPRDADLYAREPLPKPPSFNETDVSDKPSFIRQLSGLGGGAIRLAQRRYRCALASLRAVDRSVRRIYEALRTSGALDRTVIVFTSDNGYFYGEHRLRAAKHHSYEEALRVPLIMRVPSRLRNGSPQAAEIDEPVANIDLPPTLLELAGAKPCHSTADCRVMDGRSLLPLIRGHRDGWPRDRAVLIEMSVGSEPRDRSRMCRYKGVRVGGESYVRYERVQRPRAGKCEPSREVEHYDLEADPFQLDNLSPAARGTSPTPARRGEQRLSRLVRKLRDCAGIRGRDPRPGRQRSFCE